MKKILSVIFSLLLCFSVGGFIATNSTARASEAAPILVSELFLPSGASLEPVSVDSQVTYLEYGLRLKSNNVKESVKLKSDVVGDFSIDYFPEKENGLATASKFKITFTEENGDAFDLVVEHGVTQNVYVEVNGVKAGAFYNNGKLGGLTTLCNGKGTYTQISAEKITLRFDPDDMSVYACASGENETLVWCLTDDEIDGRDIGERLSPFGVYSVAFSISGLSGVTDSGSVILYSLNGCPLDEMILNESGKPSVAAQVYANAIVGESYDIPKGFVYDVKDGLTDAATVEVTKNGASVAVNGTSFTPTESGEYTLIYSATSSSGVKAEKSYEISAFAQAPACEYELDWNLSSEYSVGDKVFIPEITLRGGVLRYGETRGKLAVKKNGVSLIGYGNINSGANYTFRSVGEYTFSYDLGAGETVDFSVTVTDEKIKFITDGLNTVYVKGTLIDATAFKVLNEGVSVNYRFTVEFPNGKKYTNKKFVLSDVGIYTLRAEYNDGQNVYTFEKEITVKAQISDFFTYTASGVSISHGKSNFTGRTGVIANVSQSGQLISYTQPIDITKHVNPGKQNSDGITKITDDAIPLIEMSIDPRAYGTASATGVYVYITDAANPENVITINVNNTGNSATWSYIRAAAPGQTLVGFYTDNGTTKFDGSEGRVDDSYGFMIYNSVKGQLTTNTQTSASYHASDSKLALYYDYEKKQLLSINARAETDIVIDFDDSTFVSVPWNGFESDYVYLSFYLTGVSGGASSAVVYDIDGIDLSNKDLTYASNPVITLKDENATVAGIKGSYLLIPEASAVDCYGSALDVVKKVYFKSGEKLYDVSAADGKFYTDKVGTYYIVYRAIDAFNNVGERTVEVVVEESRPELTLSLNQSEIVSTGEVAKQISVYPAAAVVVKNAIGTAKVNRTVYFGTGVDKQEIEIESDKLYVEKAGQYLVEYTLTDATGRFASVSYVLTVTAPNHPVLVSALPTFVGFVRGNTYDIPSVYYIDYLNGTSEREMAQVYINGALYSPKTYSLDVGEVEDKNATEINETVIIEYKCGDYVLASYEVPVKTVYKMQETSMGIFGGTKDEPYFLHERFFITDDGISLSPYANRMLITSYDNDAKVYFVQPLASQNLSFELDGDLVKSFEPQTNNLVSFKVTITDALDKDKVLVLLISTDPITNQVVMTVNGETSNPFSGSLVGIAANLIKFNYSNKTNRFFDTSTGAELIVPKTYENGEKFIGFSDTVYVSFSLIGNEESDGMNLRLYSLNGQNFASDVKSDTGVPYITVNGALNGIFDVGDTIKIPTATASDVFGSITSDNFTVTVTLENNEVETFVKDVNQLELNGVTPGVEYEVKLAAAGTYRIRYLAIDSNGAGANNPVEFILTVTEQVKPVIKLKGNVPKSGTVNKEISIPDYSVKFVEESASNLYYVVAISPSYDMEVVENNKFTPTQSGTYTLRYFAIDLYGNMQMIDYDIVVYK